MKKNDVIIHFGDWKESFEVFKISKKEQNLILLSAIFYACENIEPTFKSVKAQGIWSQIIKPRIDYDQKNYANKVKAGKKSAKIRASESSAKSTESEQTLNRTSTGDEQTMNREGTDSQLYVLCSMNNDVCNSNIENSSLSYGGCSEEERESVFKFFLENDFKRHPQEFIDYNVGIGHNFSDPVKWQAWARQWEAKGYE